MEIKLFESFKGLFSKRGRLPAPIDYEKIINGHNYLLDNKEYFDEFLKFRECIDENSGSKRKQRRAIQKLKLQGDIDEYRKLVEYDERGIIDRIGEIHQKREKASRLLELNQEILWKYRNEYNFYNDGNIWDRYKRERGVEILFNHNPFSGLRDVESKFNDCCTPYSDKKCLGEMCDYRDLLEGLDYDLHKLISISRNNILGLLGDLSDQRPDAKNDLTSFKDRITQIKGVMYGSDILWSGQTANIQHDRHNYTLLKTTYDKVDDGTMTLQTAKDFVEQYLGRFMPKGQAAVKAAAIIESEKGKIEDKIEHKTHGDFDGR